MSYTEYQQVLFRLVCQPSFHELFDVDAQKALAPYFLTSLEKSRILQIKSDDIKAYRQTIKAKRKKNFDKVYAAFMRDYATVSDAVFERYFDLFPRDSGHDNLEDSARFGKYLMECLVTNPDIPSAVKEWLKFTYLDQVYRLMLAEMPVYAKQKIATDISSLDCPVLHPDVCIEHFESNASSYEEAMDFGSTGGIYLFFPTYQKHKNLILQLSSDQRRVIELCRGNLTIHDMAEMLPDYDTETLLSFIKLLVERDLLFIVPKL